MAHVAGAVFVGGTSRAPANPVHVLVAFRGVLSKIDAGTKHSTNVGVAFVKALVDDGVDKGRTWQDKFFKSINKAIDLSTVLSFQLCHL